jgi:hypothetical protein
LRWMRETSSTSRNGLCVKRAVRRTSRVMLLTVLPLLLVTSCSGKDVQLDALRSDPMASMTVPNFEQTELLTTSSGVSLGKPRHAKITRRLRNMTGHVSSRELDLVASTARDHGWVLTRLSNGEFVGTKELRSTRASIIIGVDKLRKPELLIIDLVSID